MSGKPAKAESLLRQAAAGDGSSPRIRQNLALVLGLQGKYDEAKLVAARDMPMSNASNNAEILQQVTKLEPKAVPSSVPVPADWPAEAKVAQAPAMEETAVAAVPVEKIADVQRLSPIADPQAAGDAAWVVSTDAPAAHAAKPNSTVMSVSEMAKQFAINDDAGEETVPAPAVRTSGWSSEVAQVKR